MPVQSVLYHLFLFGLFSELPWYVEIGATITLVSSLAGNILQFVINKRDLTHRIDSETIASLERSKTATKGELETVTFVNEKLKGSLDSVSEEYKTLVGLDMQFVLELAREGLHLEIGRLKKRIGTLARRLSKYEEVEEDK